jgi:hypothetical protein
MTPPGTLSDLKAIVVRLNAEFDLKIECSDRELEELQWALGRVMGQFFAEARRPTTKAVNVRLARLEHACSQIIEILTYERGGYLDLSPVNLAAFFRLKETLSLSPPLCTMEGASVLVLSLLEQAEQVKRACGVARGDLQNKPLFRYVSVTGTPKNKPLLSAAVGRSGATRSPRD